MLSDGQGREKGNFTRYYFSMEGERGGRENSPARLEGKKDKKEYPK